MLKRLGKWMCSRGFHKKRLFGYAREDGNYIIRCERDGCDWKEERDWGVVPNKPSYIPPPPEKSEELSDEFGLPKVADKDVPPMPKCKPPMIELALCGKPGKGRIRSITGPDKVFNSIDELIEEFGEGKLRISPKDDDVCRKEDTAA